jgi:hypothetical protein
MQGFCPLDRHAPEDYQAEMDKDGRKLTESEADRATRLAARLRDNLRRRKEQARARERPEADVEGAPDATASDGD